MKIKEFIDEEYKTKTIYPPKDEIFNAFKLCSIDNVKVVILGQDPYHNIGQAHGLAFSVPDGIQRPPSLLNIFKELNSKLLKEKEEITDALCKAKDSVPDPIDYKDQIIKFTDTIEILENPNLDAVTKNRHLSEIVERIEYYRPPNVKLTKANRHLYGYDKLNGPGKGLKYHREPYEIHITIK